MQNKMQLFDKFLEYSRLDAKTYQREGVEWCIKNECSQNPIHGVRGGIIADEMGLGKTITMIGVIVANMKPTTLVVLPVALLYQWYAAIEKTTGHKAVIYHGSREKKKHSIEDLKKAPVVLTTYGSVVMDAKKNDKLSKIKWDRIIFDEAHHLRNKNTKLFISSLRLEAKIKWLVTGTPIQNAMSDLYALLSILGFPLEYYVDTANQKKIVQDFVMMRTKSQVSIELPELSEKRETISWSSPSEQLLAEQLHENLSFSNLREYRMRNEASGSTTDIPVKYRLAVYNYAKQMCVYPYMIKHKLPFMKLTNIIDIDNPNVDIEDSKKLTKVVDDLISRMGNGNKKLIFCDYQEQAYRIDDMLRRQEVRDVEIIEGRTTLKSRRNIITKSPEFLIMQIKTGNEGLNLQQYNEIYILSPGWNPCIEDQAIARSHRIGQTRPVSVYRYIMSGFDGENFTQNIENYCESVQRAKRDLNKVFSSSSEQDTDAPSQEQVVE